MMLVANVILSAYTECKSSPYEGYHKMLQKWLEIGKLEPGEFW